MNAQEGQLVLIPEERPEGRPQYISLDELPPDEELVGTPTAEFVESVRRYGVLQPIVIWDRGDSYGVAAGRRRVKAARQVGLERVPAVVVDGADPATIALIENRQRTRNPLSDLEAVKGLIERGATMNDICAATGLTKQEADALLRFDNLRPELQQGVREGKIAVSVAREAAKRNSRDQAKLVAKMEARGKLHASDIHEVRTATREQALATIPAAVFAGPTLAPAWKPRARAALGQLRAAIGEHATKEVADALLIVGKWLERDEGQSNP